MENKIPTELDLLTQIEKHLKSIRSMVQFFVLLAILAIALQACSALLTL